jgi:acyl carrier protein
MEELVNKLAEILEVDELDVKKSFADYDEFDSLALLSILAMLDSDYHMSMSAKEIRSHATIEDFCNQVINH